MTWGLLIGAVFLVGCPGPEDRRKLEAIFSFEGFIDKLAGRFGADLKAGRGFTFHGEGEAGPHPPAPSPIGEGETPTAWTLSLSDYMVRPLAQPADSWLAEVRFILVKSGEECLPSPETREVYIDFIGDATKWTPYLGASRTRLGDREGNAPLWRVWESDSEDWTYLVETVAELTHPAQETSQ